MRPKWKVVKGNWAGWRVQRGDEVVAVFTEWGRAFRYALQEAVYDGLSIHHIEVTA